MYPVSCENMAEEKENKDQIESKKDKPQSEAMDFFESMRKEVTSKLIKLLTTSEDDKGAVFLTYRAKEISNNNPFLETEILQFIYNNKPKDYAEAYHFLNMFKLNEIVKYATKQLSNESLKYELKNEQSKIAMKTAYEYSRSMVAVKAYRYGLNITNNTNNTLNQLNIGTNANQYNKTKEAKGTTEEKPKAIDYQSREDLSLKQLITEDDIKITEMEAETRAESKLESIHQHPRDLIDKKILGKIVAREKASIEEYETVPTKKRK